MKRALHCLLLLLVAALGFLAASQNVREVFFRGQIYFVDDDCYARMTRVQRVDAQPGTVVRHHDFENYPVGIRSHATAPLDYAIAGLKRVLVGVYTLVPASAAVWVFQPQALDLAGALISPLLGVLIVGYLGWWALWGLAWPAEGGRGWAWLVPVFAAISPVLAHGFALGRPDHQAPQLLLLAVALTAELALLERACVEKVQRRWGLVAGLAWGVALWVSLMEPLVFAVLTALFLAVVERRRLLARARAVEAGALGLVLGAMLLVEGWPALSPGPVVQEFFPRWTSTISEMRGLWAAPGALFRWVGLGVVAAPILLALRLKADARAAYLLVLLLAMLGLTAAFLRWGYFLALVYAISLPWQVAWVRRHWLVPILALVSLYPVALEWEELLYLHRDLPAREAAEGRLLERQRERALLREAAQAMRAQAGRWPFLAPWWNAPALAYWSGQPGVTGSAHQDLPGILESARFYLSEDALAAGAILEKRGVAYVVADAPERVIQTSAALLGTEAPRKPLALALYQRPHSAAPYLSPVFSNSYFKVFAVNHNFIPHE